MATSGSTSVTVTAYDTLKFSWWRNSYNIAGNYTDIGWKMELIATNYGYISSSVAKNWSVTVNGTNYSGTNYISINNNTTKTLASGTTRIYHNADGTKSFSYSFSQVFNMNFNGYIGTKSGSGSATLDTIPRYANITKHYIKNTGLNSITVHYEVDANITTVDYSLNNGPWVNTAGLPEYTIYNLNPNTNYSIKTRIRRADSGLYTESGAITGTTKNIATISSAPNINFGDTARIIISNPSSATKNLRIECGGSTVVTRNNIGNDVTVTFSDSEWDNFYKKLGNNNSITIRYVIDTKGNSTYYNWVDKTLTLKGNQKTIKNKISGSWKRAKLWIKVNGAWKRAVIWVKINGTWRRGI